MIYTGTSLGVLRCHLCMSRSWSQIAARFVSKNYSTAIAVGIAAAYRHVHQLAGVNGFITLVNCQK